MLILIYIFSIDRSRGYENPSLNIIVIEHCLTGGCPLEEAHEHCFLNQSAFSIAISYIIYVYCEDYVGYLLLFYYFQHFVFVLHILYIWYLASGIRELSWAEIVVNFFFRVEMYSSVFKPQRYIITCINPWLRDSYTQEI